jgi:hypothetical protein
MFIAAAILAAVAALLFFRRSRQRFDMVATLASIAEARSSGTISGTSRTKRSPAS